jgi:5-methylcytosine-specific restriction protein A
MSDRRATASGRRRARDTGPGRATREAVLERDGYACVMCGKGPHGLQVHHRKPRRMGGRSESGINAPSNLVTLCEADHAWAESRRAEALEMGLLLHEADDPAKVPVLHHEHGPIRLDNKGGWKPVGGEG